MTYETRVFEGMNSTGDYQIVTDGPGAKCPTCGYPERHRIFVIGTEREPVLTADGCPSCETSRMPVERELCGACDAMLPMDCTCPQPNERESR